MPQIDLATLAIKADTTDLARVDTALNKIGKQAKTTETAAGNISKSFKAMGIAVVGGAAVAGAAVTALGVKSISTFRDLEVRLVGVQKTTDFTAAEMVKFGDKIDDISRKVPIATASLLDISGVAGQLGIKGVDNVAKFTEVVGKLTLATDIVGEEGAASIARLINVTGESIDTVDKFGAVLVALGNNSAATESEILSLATQIGQATSTFSVSSAEALAMGAAMKSLGVSAELGGSVVGRAMREIEAAINAGGDSLENLSIVTGIAADDLKEQFGENATAVFQRWVEGIGGMIDGGMSAAEALEMFNIRGEEALKVLPTMAVNSEILAKSLNIANKELETGAALNNEVAKASETLDSQITIAQNILTDYAAEIGENLAPKLKETIADFRAWDDATGDLVKQDLAGWVGSGVDAVVMFGKSITVIDEVLGIAFADWSIGWENFVFSWEKGTLNLSSSFGLAFDQIKLTAAEGLENIAGNMATLPLIGDDIAEKFAGASENIRASATATAKYEEELAKLTGAHEANVRALEFYKQQQAETIDLTFASTTATKTEAEQSTETADKVVKNEQKVIAAKKETQDVTDRLREKNKRDQEKATADQLRLQEDLSTEIKRLTVEEFWFKTDMLDKEVEKMYEVAGTDKDLQDQIARYHELKQDEILDDYNEKNQSLIEKSILNSDTLKDINQTVVDAFVSGENVKLSLARLAQEKLSDLAVDAANEGIPLILEGIGQQVGAWVGLGAAESTTDGESVIQKLASGALYLAQAGAAVLAGKAVGENFADGGWVGRHPAGGHIAEGSYSADDVFLGMTGPVENYAMGGEFVINKEATAANRDIIELINEEGRGRRLFADGGFARWPWDKDAKNDWRDRPKPAGLNAKGTVSDDRIWSATENINDNGFSTFITSLLTSGFNWYKAIIDSIIYYGGTGIGMMIGKEIGPNLFADGGETPKSPTDVLDNIPEEPNNPLGDLISTILDILGWDPGEIWDYLRDTKGVHRFVERVDRAVFPFVRDTATPGKDITWETIENSIEASYDGLLDDIIASLVELIEEAVEDIVDPFGIFKDGGILGSYENGTSYVPATGIYELHQGERVIPAEENKIIGNDMGQMVRMLTAIEYNTKETMRYARKWDVDGIPEERTI